MATSSYINSPFVPARLPRARVMLAGNQLPPIKTFNVSTTNNLHADTFELSLPLRADNIHTTNWWSNLAPGQLVDIQVGNLGTNNPSNSQISYQSLMTGQIDDIHVDHWNGVVQCSGRDLSSNFIDTKLTNSFQNVSSSAIVQQLAAKHGMQANVDATAAPVGRYYETDHTNTKNGELAKHPTEWDFMCWLAQKENYDLYVIGNTVYFKNAVNETNPTNGVWLANAPLWSFSNGVASCTMAGNVTSLNMSRSLTLAKDVKVIVQGFHSRTGKSFTATAERNKGFTSGTTQTYVYNVRNITQADAQVLANNYLSDISRHEFLLEFDAPADVAMTSRTLVQLQNTSSAFDITYIIDSIRWSFHQSNGFDMHVHAKNHNTQNQATV